MSMSHGGKEIRQAMNLSGELTVKSASNKAAGSYPTLEAP